ADSPDTGGPEDAYREAVPVHRPVLRTGTAADGELLDRQGHQAGDDPTRLLEAATRRGERRLRRVAPLGHEALPAPRAPDRERRLRPLGVRGAARGEADDRTARGRVRDGRTRAQVRPRGPARTLLPAPGRAGNLHRPGAASDTRRPGELGHRLHGTGG